MKKAPIALAAFSAVALSACQWTIGTKPKELTEDLTCTSEIVDQTIELNAGEKIFSFKTSDGQPYHGLSREFVEQDGAITITTEHEIKMYDHDRWICENNNGQRIDYKTLEPIGTN